MSKIPELLRELADEIAQKEAQEDLNLITTNAQISEIMRISDKNKAKLREIANAFSSFANILGRED